MSNINIEKKKKILVIVNGGLPIPSIKGGAIETLINLFVDDNEIKNKYDISIYSNYCDGIEKYANKYSNTHFYYIDTNNILYKISYAIRGVIRRFLKINIKSAFTARLLKMEKNSINNYDVILVENYISCIEPIAKKYNGKIVAHLHNDSIINAKYHNGVGIIDKCCKILTVSEFIKNRVNSVKKTNKVEVVYNGIDRNLFKPNFNNREKLRKKYGINKDDIVFLFSGRVCEEKGVLQLIEAFKKVASKYENSKLVIVGSSFFSENNDSPFIKKLKDITSSMQDKIIFTGYIKHDNIHEIYQAVDVLMLPTMIEDAMPLTLLEGIACGLPAIVTDSGGMPEILGKDYKMIVDRKKINEELVQYMDEIISNNKIKRELAENAFKRSKEFSLEKYLDTFWKSIDCVIDEK